MPKPATTRDRILARGLALMSESGLNGITLGVLAEQVGMSKSGLFAHFDSKEDVQVALLEHALALGETHIIRPAMNQPEGLPRLKAVVRNWLGWAPRSGLPGGCPVAAGMFELDDIENAVRDKLRSMEANWREFLEELTRKSIACGHLHKDLDVEQFVWELCGIYLSHHAFQRFVRSPEADARAERAFASLIERSLPRPMGRGTKEHIKKGAKP